MDMGTDMEMAMDINIDTNTRTVTQDATPCPMLDHSVHGAWTSAQIGRYRLMKSKRTGPFLIGGRLLVQVGGLLSWFDKILALPYLA